MSPRSPVALLHRHARCGFLEHESLRRRRMTASSSHEIDRRIEVISNVQRGRSSNPSASGGSSLR